MIQTVNLASRPAGVESRWLDVRTEDEPFPVASAMKMAVCFATQPKWLPLESHAGSSWGAESVVRRRK